jgi:hypothetical protein
VDPVQDPLLLIKYGRAGTSGSVARNSDHQTTEAVDICISIILNTSQHEAQMLKFQVAKHLINSLFLRSKYPARLYFSLNILGVTDEV